MVNGVGAGGGGGHKDGDIDGCCHSLLFMAPGNSRQGMLFLAASHRDPGGPQGGGGDHPDTSCWSDSNLRSTLGQLPTLVTELDQWLGGVQR